MTSPRTGDRPLSRTESWEHVASPSPPSSAASSVDSPVQGLQRLIFHYLCLLLLQGHASHHRNSSDRRGMNAALPSDSDSHQSFESSDAEDEAESRKPMLQAKGLSPPLTTAAALQQVQPHFCCLLQPQNRW